MRFYDGSFQYYGVAGSLEGVAYANFHQMVYNAWLNWYQNADLGFITEGASTDTSGNNCRIGVLSSQTFGGLGFGYTVGGGGALMISRYSPGSGGNIRTDGTIKFGRTYVRGDADADFAWVE